MSDRVRKEQQRKHIERLLESDLSVPEWCKRNNIARQSMYGWLGEFAEKEPELFGGEQNIVDRSRRRWVESTRLNISSSRALAIRHSPGVILIDSLFADTSQGSLSAPTAKTGAINVKLNGADISIPSGCAFDDVSVVLKAAALL